MSHAQASTRSSSPYWYNGYCAADLLRQQAPALRAEWSKQTLQSVSKYHGTLLPESRHQPCTRARGNRLQQHPDRLGQPQGEAAARLVLSKRSTRLPHIHIYLHKPARHAIPTVSSGKSDLVLLCRQHSAPERNSSSASRCHSASDGSVMVSQSQHDALSCPPRPAAEPRLASLPSAEVCTLETSDHDLSQA